MVFNIMRYCVHDGPGIRTAVFLKGCPMHCSWCHNPEGQNRGLELSFREERCVRCGDCFELCPNGAIERVGETFIPRREVCGRCGSCVDRCYAEAREIVGKQMTVAEVMNEVMKDVAFYDDSGGGVTFTGGEPLFQPAFLESLLESSRGLGIHTTVETAGFAAPEVLRRIGAQTDLFLYDLKLMDDEAHRRFTGVSNLQILRNLRLLASDGRQVIVRIPLIPGINDHEENVRSSCEFLVSLGAIREVHLLPFHRIGRDKYERLGRPSTMPGIDAMPDDTMAAIGRMIESYGFTVAMGG